MSLVVPFWQRLTRSWWPFIMVGLALTGISCLTAYQFQLDRYENRFNQFSESKFQSVHQRFTIAEASLDALAGLYQASNEMDSALFTPFTQSFLQEYSFIDSAQYVSHVTPSEKEEFIEEIREQGFSQFEIHHNSPVAASHSRMTFYLVTHFIEPLTPSSAAMMGLNWNTEPSIQNYFLSLASTGKTGLTASPEDLNSGEQLVFLKPTYFGRTKPKTPEQRSQQFSGFFLLFVNREQLTRVDSDQKHKINFDIKLLDRYSGRFDDDIDIQPANLDREFFRYEDIALGNVRARISARSSYRYTITEALQVMAVGIVVSLVYSICLIAGRNRYLFKRAKIKAQRQLYKERERAEVTLKSIGDAVITTDIDQNVNYISPVAETLLNCRLESVIGMNIADLVHLQSLPSKNPIEDPISFYLDFTQSKFSQAGIDVVLSVNDKQISVDGNAAPMLDLNHEFIGSVLVMRDISLERELTNELVYQASHDSLTGLLNRAEFDKWLNESLESSQQRNIEHALCYLDMDQFKLINDTCGHIAGDELLKQVTGLLQVQMRENDIVARLGGDEFGVLIHNCDENKAREIAERIRNSLNDCHFKWQDKVFDVSASIGLVMINPLSGNLSDILSAADLACYAAKDAGRNAVHLYHAQDQEISKKIDQMQWLPRIREALLNDEFKLAIQHILPLSKESQDPHIFEILIRWPQTDGSLLSPAIFIPSAERYDLMNELDRWVIRNALRLIPEIIRQQGDISNIMFTINLSGQSISDSTLADFILNEIRQCQIDPILICFEVTETVAIANFSIANDFIRQLRNHGCRFALDDFGSGLSSFGYLKMLPLDLLKIDGFFVRDMMKDPVDLAMVRAIHEVARVLNLQTIAEWVEDEEVLDTLKEIGIDYAQGFHLHKPEIVAI